MPHAVAGLSAAGEVCANRNFSVNCRADAAGCQYQGSAWNIARWSVSAKRVAVPSLMRFGTLARCVFCSVAWEDHRCVSRVRKTFLGFLMFMVVGAAFAWGANSYTIGTGARRGRATFRWCWVSCWPVGRDHHRQIVAGCHGRWRTIGRFRFAWRPLDFHHPGQPGFGALIGGLPSIHLPPMGWWRPSMP